MRKNQAYSSGVSVGVEANRGGVLLSNCGDLGYTIKCPFPYYYCTPVSIDNLAPKERKRISSCITVQEKISTLVGYEREIMQCTAIKIQYTNKVDSYARTILACIEMAKLELSYYNPNDKIVTLGKDIKDSNPLERAEIGNRISSWRQQFGLNNNMSNPISTFKRNTRNSGVQGTFSNNMSKA